MPITTVIDNITYIFTDKLTDDTYVYEPIKLTITDKLDSFEPILDIIDNIRKNKTKNTSIICNPIINYKKTISNLLKKLA